MAKLAHLGNHRPGVNSTEKYVADALENIGHEVIRLQENDVDHALLADRLRAWGVDTVFWTRTPSYQLDPAEQRVFVERCVLRGVRTVGLHLDKYWSLKRERDIFEHPWWRQDVVMTADGGNQQRFEAAGVNHYWWRPAVSASQCGRGKFNPDYAIPVAFVGSQRYHSEWPWRQQLLKYMATNYRRTFRQFGRSGDRLADDQLADAYASVDVVIGDSCLVGGTGRYFSNRIPETLGRGGFLLHPYVDGVDEWYRDGEHLVWYKAGDCRSLRTMIDKWLADPEGRARISEAGMRQVMATETFEVRMRSVCDQLGITAPKAVTHA